MKKLYPILNSVFGRNMAHSKLFTYAKPPTESISIIDEEIIGGGVNDAK